jgi:hypothetical protein
MLTHREIKAESIYWMYSRRGPDDNRKIGEYQLAGGVMTVPVMGVTARKLAASGLQAAPAEVLGRPVMVQGPSGGWVISSISEPVPPPQIVPVEPEGSVIRRRRRPQVALAPVSSDGNY